MPPTYGGAPKCITCNKSVYFAEQQFGPGGKIYHKGCLKCLSCSKSLDALHLVDREGEPYCKSCYSKNFGAKGYGAGGALVGDYAAASPTNSPELSQRPLSPPPAPAPVPALPPPPSLPPRFTQRPSVASSTTASESSYERPTSPISSVGTMDSLPSSTSGSARSWANGGNGSPVRTGRDLCRRCGEVVYAAESVLAAGQKWHKRCLRCAECSTALSSHLTEKDGLPWCQKCYTKRFGIQSQGIMSRPGLY